MKLAGLLSAAVLVLGFGSFPGARAEAGWRDCGQPTTSGEKPTATDALSILYAAVGTPGPCDAIPCICDVSDDGKISASDALRTLKHAVGQDIPLNCAEGCGSLAACTGATLTFLPGSEIDYGWTGIAHDSEISNGSSLSLVVVKRCSSDDSICTSDGDCPSGGSCTPTCDCNGDTSCELTLGEGNSRCRTTLESCEPDRCRMGFLTTNEACSSNADCEEVGETATCTGSSSCGNGVECIDAFSPPLPFSSGGTPTCGQTFFSSPLLLTADFESGVIEYSTSLRWSMKLGITLDKPCPRCGAPDADPQPGEEFTCDGGPKNGQACTVEAVHPVFGGTSWDCPADVAAGVSGADLAIPLASATTETTSRTAQLPCGNSQFRSNPLFPASQCVGGSNDGNACTSNANCPLGFCNLPKCLDTGESCTSNADCTRCSGDSSIACSSNEDCSDKGSCAEAPGQPVTCGYWCHCGFCNGNAAAPCIEDAQCPEGEQCVAGTGSSIQSNAPQQKPNDCASDAFVCGALAGEVCATTEYGECSGQPYRSCIEGSSDCDFGNAGVCVVTPRPCFEPTISRSGEAQAIGRRCTNSGAGCSDNADCGGSACLDDAALAETVAVTCMPASSSTSINSVGGITGPAALRLRHRIVFHRQAAP